MSTRRINTLFALVTAICLQTGCLLRAENPANVGVDSVTYQPSASISSANISIAATLLRKESEKDAARYSFADSGPGLEAIRTGIREGLLLANSNLRTSDSANVSVSMICSSGGSKDKRTNNVDAQNCVLPSQLPPSNDTSPSEQSNLLLLVRGETEVIKGKVEVIPGAGAGAGGVAPLLFEGKTNHHTFSLLARLYDSRSGRMVAEASTTVRAEENYGFLFFIPMNIDIPDETGNYSVMGRAIGMKLGKLLHSELK